MYLKYITFKQCQSQAWISNIMYRGVCFMFNE